MACIEQFKISYPEKIKKKTIPHKVSTLYHIACPCAIWPHKRYRVSSPNKKDIFHAFHDYSLEISVWENRFMMTEISWKFSGIKGETERKEKQRIPMKPQASFFLHLSRNWKKAWKVQNKRNIFFSNSLRRRKKHLSNNFKVIFNATLSCSVWRGCIDFSLAYSSFISKSLFNHLLNQNALPKGWDWFLWCYIMRSERNSAGCFRSHRVMDVNVYNN